MYGANGFEILMAVLVGMPIVYLMALTLLLGVGGVIGCARCFFGDFAESEVGVAASPSYSAVQR